MTTLKKYNYPLKTAMQEVDEQAKSLVETHQMKYKEACAAVLSRDAGLARRYSQEQEAATGFREAEPKMLKFQREIKDAEKQLHDKVELFMLQHNVSYKQAFRVVLSDEANSELVKLYLMPRC